MSPLATAALVAPLAVAAAWCLWRGLRPRRRTIAEVRAILRPPAVATAPMGAGRALLAATRPGITAPLADHVERRLGTGLALVGMTGADVVARVLVGLGVGTGTAAAAIGSLVAAGTLPLTPVWLPLCLAAGAGAGVVMWSDVRARIERRRRELRRTTNDVVQLIAVGLTTDQSVEEAVHFALGVGDSDMFDLLRDELASAPLRGVTLWEALDGLGRRHDQRELCELATSIERQGTHGVSISDTVTSLATSMRAKALDQLERDADRANANLVAPTVGFVCTTLVFLAFPLAMRITEAFGG